MDDYTPKVGYSTETEIEWRQRLDHRLNNIERLLFHLRDEIVHSSDAEYWKQKFMEEVFGSKR